MAIHGCGVVRVGFVLSHVDGRWTGGLNYLANLLHAILAIPDRSIEPVLFVPSDHVSSLKIIPAGLEVVPIDLSRQALTSRVLRKVEQYALGTDIKLQRVLQENQIDVLSHSGHLGRRASVPSIGWIPDFQHRRRPEFFSSREISARERGYRSLAKNCSILLLSSEDARRDLAKFLLAAVSKSEVLRFSSGLPGLTTPKAAKVVLEKYHIKSPYFHLPNQFWAHKNHSIVVDALACLQREGKQATVVCTGATDDRRAPNYFSALMTRVKAAGVADSFRVLGLVPYEDVTALMAASTSVINPSLFEGWSTTVEEAKATGKHLFLSDIPVHREQAPLRATYFDPQDAAELAKVLAERVDGYNPTEEHHSQVRADREARIMFMKFGQDYQRIVLEAVANYTTTLKRPRRGDNTVTATLNPSQAN